jgi:hypothetical protein
MKDKTCLIAIRLPLVLLIGFALGASVSAGELQQNPAAPDTEKRSSIQSVDGYAYLSENMTLGETRSAAFANAKRQALEMARTYIESKTKVEDFMVQYDLVWSEAEGAVTVLEQKDIGIENNSRYHVWIKAEVEYQLRPKRPKVAQTNTLVTNGPLTVNVWTSKKRYHRGESIEIKIQGNRNFYARIVDITSDGSIIQLLPNALRTVNYFEAGKVYKIPDKGDGFSLNVTPPYGEDRIVVYASEVPIGEVEMTKVGPGLGLFTGKQEKLAIKSRGISVTPSKPGAKPVAEFYEASWVVTTGEWKIESK